MLCASRAHGLNDGHERQQRMKQMQRKGMQQIRLELQNYNTVVAHSGHACSKVASCVNTPTYQMADQSITNEGSSHIQRMAGHLKQKIYAKS